MFRVQPFREKPLAWWYKQRSDINIKPVFQRLGNIWTPTDKAFFIDSILNGFDIPKFYIADFRYSNSLPNPSKKPYAVIDGKQRFETIFDFFDGKVQLAPDFKLYDSPGLKLAGLNYRELFLKFPEIAKKFSDYIPAVMSIITDEEGKINELFIRLNHSKPLTGGEKRNAKPGKVPPVVRVIVKHKFFTSRIRFAINRYQDRDAATKLLLIEFKGGLVDTKKKQLDALIIDGNKSDEGFERATQLVKKNLNMMFRILKPQDPLLSSQGPLTLYYWFIRKYGAKYPKVIREFLWQLEQDRKLNQVRADRREQNIDEELLNFSRVKRSPNDQGSLNTAFSILEKRFEKFIENKNIPLST